MPQLSVDPIKELVDALLAEDRQYHLKERRNVGRTPIFRPVTVYLGRSSGEPQIAFSRDISPQGIGLVHGFSIEAGRVANLAIHRLWDEPALLRCQVRWCEPYVRDWFITGWIIAGVEAS
jgi:hypothetical protein